MGVRSVRHQDTASRYGLTRRRCCPGGADGDGSGERRAGLPAEVLQDLRHLVQRARIGDSVTLTAQTYRSGSAVAVDVSDDGSSVGTSNATANSQGVATTSVTFTVEGVNRVTMSGTSDTGDDLSLAADITVTAESTTSSRSTTAATTDGSGDED